MEVVFAFFIVFRILLVKNMFGVFLLNLHKINMIYVFPVRSQQSFRFVFENLFFVLSQLTLTKNIELLLCVHPFLLIYYVFVLPLLLIVVFCMFVGVGICFYL